MSTNNQLKNFVTRLEDGLYQVKLPKKIPAKTAFVEFGMYRISVVLDDSEKYAVAIRGTKKTLLSYMMNDGATDEQLKDFEDCMPD